MNDRLQRILIFLGALIAALLVVIVAMLLTSDDTPSDSTLAASTTSEATTTTSTTTTTTLPTATPEVTEAPPASDPEPTPAADPEPPPPEPAPTPTLGPVEVSRSIANLQRGELFGTSSTPPFLASLSSTGFATSHPWWLVGLAQPGAEGCRDSSGSAVANPVGLTPLSLSVNWYGCSHMEGGLEAQLHVIDIQRDPDRVIVEVVVWDFTS